MEGRRIIKIDRLTDAVFVTCVCVQHYFLEGQRPSESQCGGHAIRDFPSSCPLSLLPRGVALGSLSMFHSGIFL